MVITTIGMFGFRLFGWDLLAILYRYPKNTPEELIIKTPETARAPGEFETVVARLKHQDRAATLSISQKLTCASGTTTVYIHYF